MTDYVNSTIGVNIFIKISNSKKFITELRN